MSILEFAGALLLVLIAGASVAVLIVLAVDAVFAKKNDG